MTSPELIFTPASAPARTADAPASSGPQPPSREPFDDVMKRLLARREHDSSDRADDSSKPRVVKPRKQKTVRASETNDCADANAATPTDSPADSPDTPPVSTVDSDLPTDSTAKGVPDQASPIAALVTANGGRAVAAMMGGDPNASLDDNSNAANSTPASTAKAETRSGGGVTAQAPERETDFDAQSLLPSTSTGREALTTIPTAKATADKSASIASDNSTGSTIDSSMQSKVVASQPVAEPHGISAAKDHLPMQTAAKEHETADLPEQNLPAGAVSSAHSSPSASAEVLAAQGAAIVSRDGASLDVSAVTISEAASGTARLLERTQDFVALHAGQLRGSSADSLHIVIKPGAGLQLSLQLQLRGREVEVQALLNHGDFHFLNRHWPELQQQLESRGVRLAALEQQPASGANADSSSQSRGQSTARETEPRAALAERTRTAAPAAARVVPRAKALMRGWESWA